MAQKLAAPTALTVKIYSPDRVVFDGTAQLVLAPGTIDTLGIFPGHTPLYAELVAGDVIVQGASESVVSIKQGILRLRDAELVLLIIPKI
jgi:F-type H+-transporting ATPase subunit epsilon